MLLVRNGKFLQQEGRGGAVQNSFAECMLIDGDEIAYVGSASEVPADNVEVIDVQGKLVVPGFVDGHMHLLLLGLSLAKLDLTPCKDLDDIRLAIKKYAAENPDAPRLLCHNWMQSMTNDEAFASMLDDLDPRPIYIDAKDLHSTWCNSAALDEMEVADMPNPTGGTIHRDANGTASGLLSEGASIGFVWPFIAKVTPRDDRMTAMRSAMNAYTAAGYTGFIEMAMDAPAWDALTELKAKEDLPIRVAAHWLILPKETVEENLAQVDVAIEQFKKSQQSPDCRITGIKVICDGVIDGCTAALSEPYSHNLENADSLWTAEQLAPVVERADRAGLQCALHAIGDRAVNMAINVIEAHGTPGSRHRIEHLETTKPEDAKRLGALGITASIQPVHSDPDILRAWPQLIGPHRCKRGFAYKDFEDGGATLAIGSDSPTAPYHPLRNLYNATTRRSTRTFESTETFNEKFKLSLGSAMAAATAGAAFSCRADHRIGSLKKGLKADFTVLDMDWDAQQLLRAEVQQTWFGGRKVYDRADRADGGH